MQVDALVWRLKSLCPVCGQGSCLAIVSCPGCGHLAVACEEEGTLFTEFRDLSSAMNASGVCPGCAKVPLSSFTPARDDAILAFGLTPAEYE